MPSGKGPIRVKKIVDQFPQEPQVEPAFTIPLDKLGFSVPGNSYLLRKQSMVSLDFLGEDRLLFTFHVPSGLLSRDADESAESSPHQVQAEVLALPSGHIESKASWTVPDRSRYLWMLNEGHFLLRVRDGLDEGDSQLNLKSYLRPPGRLLWIEMDPTQQILMTNSLVSASEAHGDDKAPAGDPPAATTDAGKGGELLMVRTMKRATGEVIHVGQFPWTHQTNDWPMNSEGYVEKLQDKNKRWILKINTYSGKSWGLTGVDSTCPQKYGFLSDTELLVTVCGPEGGWDLKGVSTDGRLLWQQKLAWNTMWPLVVVAPNGLRFARETLVLKRTINHYKRLVGAEDLYGQMVRVFDAADGKVVLETPLSPIFDGGGNVAISPSGQRVAILNGGSIQVFQLPAPPPLPKRELLSKPTAVKASASAPPAR
jgi:hypothetical protein